MSLNLPSYSLLNYKSNLAAPAQASVVGAAAVEVKPKAALKAIRQDASALLKSFAQPAAPVAMTAAPIWSPTLLQNSSLFTSLKSLLGSLSNLLGGWLTTPATPAPAPTTPGTQPPKQPLKKTELVISSFNVLGSSHTKPGGNKPNMASGVARIRLAAELLDKHKVDVVGFQEFQRDQYLEFKKVAGDKYGVYPGFELGKPEVVNSIAWNKKEWEMVKPGHIEIPYFDGHKRKMPVVRLRNKQTGQEAYFANFHNPASTRTQGNHEKWREVAEDKQVALVNRLMKETGLPVFVTGDMNEREDYYNKMTAKTPMISADEGPKGQRPKKMNIDWIFGTPEVKFSDFTKDRGALVQKTTDHPMIVSKATIGG